MADMSLAELQRIQRKKAKRAARAGTEEKTELKMTSLMDISVNVLIYLLNHHA